MGGRRPRAGIRLWLTGAMCIALAPGGAASAGPGSEPTLGAVLQRAAAYVTTLQQQLSGIVAEETYVQEVVVGDGRMLPTRRLRSDLLLVRPAGADRYVEYRDVFEVNGRAVRDRAERVTRLFLSPTAAARDQLRAIIDESARHNLGAIPRNINTPMLALYFLQPDMQSRFRFRRERAREPELATPTAMPRGDHTVFRATTAMWVVRYTERQRPTIIKTAEGRDLRTDGRVWLDPATGRVYMSELAVNTDQMSAVINVSYQSEPLLGFLVPVEMRERYRSSAERVDGVATYGRFRQFQVTTGQVIGKPPGGLQ